MVLWATAGLAAPQVTAVTFRGPVGPDGAEMRAQTWFLVHGPALPARLVDAVRSLEQVRGVGGVDVHTEGDAERVTVTFEYDGRDRRVDSTAALDPDLPPAWGQHLMERLRGGLRLRPGERYHPYLTYLDRELLRSFLVSRGYRDATVSATVEPVGESVAVTYRVARGPLSVAARVELLGDTFDPPTRAALVSGLKVQAGRPIDPAALDADAERLRRWQCRAGHPRAAVTVGEALVSQPSGAAPGPVSERRFAVTYELDPGPAVRTGRVQVVGRFIPWDVLAALPLRDDMPFCEDLVDREISALQTWLADHGVLRPDIRVHRTPTRWTDGTWTVALTFEVQRPANVRIGRIWFVGARVTGQRVLTTLLEIHEGDLYRQSAVDATVQSLRRSGLFRTVDALVEPAPEAGFAYLTFRLEERDPIGFDVTNQRLIFQNVDLGRWPEDWEEFEEGPALRGDGQRLDIYGQVGRQGIEWRNPLLGRHLIAQVLLNRFDGDADTFEDTWYQLVGGFGLRFLEGRGILLPLVQVELVFASQDATEPLLPILEDTTVTATGGLRASLDLNQLDDERIPYLGFDATFEGAGGGAVDGTARWVEDSGRIRVHLPLWTTDDDQHFVLRLRTSLQQVHVIDGVLAAHRRLFPSARGYGSRALATPVLRGGLTEKLGALQAAEGTAELRIPAPVGRRNAVVPFADAMSIAERTGDLLDDIYPSAGVALTFSLFSERVEGVLWGAWPLRDELSATYVGASIGGSF